jgi:hypothetical protein
MEAEQQQGPAQAQAPNELLQQWVHQQFQNHNQVVGQALANQNELNLANNAQAAQAAQAAAQAGLAAVQANLGSMPRGYRPEGAPKYYGRTGEDVEAWLFQMEEVNRLFPINDEIQRIRYTALALRDTASKWYESMQMRNPPGILSWEEFKTKLRSQFVHLDQKWVARNSLFALTQNGNVRDYTVKFRNLMLLIPDMSTADALDKYIRGLKDFAWKVWRKRFQILEEAMIYAEGLDLEIQQKAALSRRTVSTTKQPVAQSSPAASRPIHWQPRHPTSNVQGGFNRGGPAPMELGATSMSETERNRHMQLDLCFYCHKPGHRSNVCPQKDQSGNGQRRR